MRPEDDYRLHDANPNGDPRKQRGRRRRLALVHRKINELYREDGWAPVRMVAVSIGLGITGLALLIPTALLTAYLYFAAGLPAADYAEKRPVFQSTLFYDRNGELLYEWFDPTGGRRTLSHLEDLPPQLIQATISAEDPTFYDNPGIDPVAGTRALLQNFTSGGIQSGASTLTMQLARNVLFSPEQRLVQSVDRKAKEAIYALRLTQAYPKDRILEMYFNEAYYGNMSYGAVAAARAYFGKHARDLTLPEVAMLAGLPQAPTDYNPILNPDQAYTRRAYVLDRMVREGYITQEEADEAKATPLTFADQSFPLRAPHFVDYVKEQLERRYGRDAVYNGGWSIQTTVDLGLTQIAERDARKRVSELREQMNVHNAAIVAIKPATGEILTMLGSIDYWDDSIDGRVNVANSLRMPGSSVKPFNYVTGYQLGYVPNSRIADVKSCFEVAPNLPLFCPQNFDYKFNGSVMLREALASSLNIPAVRLLQHVGPERMADTAHRFGITTLREPYRFGLTLTLGASEVKLLDISFAYSVFANNGQMIGAPVPLAEREMGMREYEPVAVLRITDPDGKTIYQYDPPAPREVYSPQASWLITTSLSEDENRHFTFARGGDLVIDRPAAAKTGTTQFLQDTWTIGYTPDLVAGIWVGNSDGEEMRQIAGLVSAGSIWHTFMIDAHRYLQLPPRDFTPPPGVAYGPVCGDDGWYIEDRTPICYVD